MDSSTAACATPTACDATLDAARGEEVHQLVEPLVLLADDVLRGNAHVVEDDFREVGGADAEFVVDLRRFEPVRVGGNEDGADAAMGRFGLGVRLRHHDGDVGDGSVRYPHLVAVDDVLVALRFGDRLDSGDVRPVTRFGDTATAGGLAVGDSREPLLFHPLVAELPNHVRAEPATANGAPDTRVGPPEFLGDDDGREGVHSCPAVLDRDARGHEVQFRRLPNEVLGILLLLVVFAGDRRDFRLAELPDRLPYRTLFV